MITRAKNSTWLSAWLEPRLGRQFVAAQDGKLFGGGGLSAELVLDAVTELIQVRPRPIERSDDGVRHDATLEHPPYDEQDARVARTHLARTSLVLDRLAHRCVGLAVHDGVVVVPVAGCVVEPVIEPVGDRATIRNLEAQNLIDAFGTEPSERSCWHTPPLPKSA